jgi:hypothetical protein
MAKKKANIHAQQQKLQAVQHRKAFMQKLRTYCTMMGDASWFDLLPDYVLDTIYLNRGTSFKIRVEEGAKITKRFIKILYTHIDERLKSETIELLPDTNKKVNLFDYYQVVHPLESVLAQEYITFKGKEMFRDFYISENDQFNKYHRGIAYIIHSACYAFCDMGKRFLYTFTYNIKENFSSRDHDARKHQLVTIGTIPLDVRYVSIDGDRRPVYLVGEVLHSKNVSTIRPAEVSLRRLRIPDAKPGEKAPVYIQQHAIDRIMTRAYCSFPGTVGSLVEKAFLNKRKIIPSGKNRYLIECFFDDIKIGYFSALYIDGILVIRTFLLPTHNGTPEGKKLEQLTGLQKKDKAYLALDDLRSLANSDIIYDDDVRKIFMEAGCESMLELCERVQWGFEYDWLWERTTQSHKLSQLIREYIQLGANDEEYFVNSDD